MHLAFNCTLRIFKIALLCLLLSLTNMVWAIDFTVRDIRIDGLERISEGLVINSLPVRIGQMINDDDVRLVVANLYEQGFFSDIKIGQDKDTLVIKVVERPSIKSVTVKGNRVLKSEALLDGLKNAGIAENLVYNPGILENIRQELVREYVSQGMYQAAIETEVEDEGNNQVAITLDIKESSVAKIKSIVFTGNKSYSPVELKELMNSHETHWLKFWTKKDRYLKSKLEDDIDIITSFYLDNGFLKFSVESVQVNVDQERKGVVINIALNEGQAYKIDNVRFLSPKIQEQEEVQKSLKTLKNEVYSQAKVTAIEGVLAQILGAQGYAFARIKAVPEFKGDSNLVDLVFAIEKGKRSYVRRINFSGNTQTQDHVLRREMRQLESAPANTSLIEQSKLRLQRIGYFKDVKVETVPVPGADDLVDVNFTVEEEFSGSIGASFGYADGSGVQFGGNLEQNNFMGTGKRVAIGLNRNKYQTGVNFGLTNPYYTKDGVSRGFNVFYQKTDYDDIDISNYSVDRYGANVSFGYPLSETQRIGFSFGYQRTDIQTGFNTPQEIETSFAAGDPITPGTGFLDVEGDSYDLLLINAFWRQSSLNRSRFATRGSSQKISFEATVPGIDIDYFKLTYDGQRFFPIGEDYALRLRTKLGYGDGYGGTSELPFFENFFAGGFNSVRGFDQNSLGPHGRPSKRPGADMDSDPLGGDILTEFGADFIFPAPFIKDKRTVQTSFFVDAGNIFESDCGRRNIKDFNCSDFEFDELRYSVGLGVNWQTFIGPLSFSIAQPFNDSNLDDTKVFQFSIGSGF